MKKTTISLVILSLILIFTSCNISTDNIDQTDKNDNYTDDMDSSLPKYKSIEEFKEVIYNGDLQSKYRKCYVEFASIIPNEEIDSIVAGIEYETDGGDIGMEVAMYSLIYKTDGKPEDRLTIGIGYGIFFTKHFITPYKESILSNGGKIYDTFDALPEGNTESFIMDVDGVYLLYQYFENKPWSIQFMIDEHYFYIHSFIPASLAQEEFISAFLPEYGATDDSVIAMLDKVKALIPQ